MNRICPPSFSTYICGYHSSNNDQSINEVIANNLKENQCIKFGTV